MKVNLKPVGDPVGCGEVFRVRSSSNPFLWHFTVVLTEPDADGNLVVCSCTGWQTHAKCWHTDEALNWVTVRGEDETRTEVQTVSEDHTLESD